VASAHTHTLRPKFERQRREQAHLGHAADAGALEHTTPLPRAPAPLCRQCQPYHRPRRADTATNRNRVPRQGSRHRALQRFDTFILDLRAMGTQVHMQRAAFAGSQTAIQAQRLGAEYPR